MELQRNPQRDRSVKPCTAEEVKAKQEQGGAYAKCLNLTTFVTALMNERGCMLQGSATHAEVLMMPATHDQIPEPPPTRFASGTSLSRDAL